MTETLRSQWPWIGIQLLLSAVAGAMLLLIPPASGRLLLVPVTTRAATQVAAVAVAAGARFVARGPLPGSLVVEGRRDAMRGAFQTTSVLVLTAPTAGCGR